MPRISNYSAVIQTASHAAKRIVLIVVASFLMSLNINTFVHAGGLIPGGFTGLALLIQEVAARFFDAYIPFSLLLYAFNVVPVILGFLVIGRYFTLYSIFFVLLTGVLTDFMPTMFIAFLQLHDVFLSAVFGGIVNALSITLCLIAGATSGGSDIIAIAISEKFGKDAWGYIFIGNCVILAIAAYLFSLEKALYSIIFQYATTVGLRTLYHGYQQKTLLIITEKPDEVYTLIRDVTHHAATSFSGFGHYETKPRTMLYSVVSHDDAPRLYNEIKKIDPNAFINTIRTEAIQGNFSRKAKD
ncbi:MAG: YitT family protein [Treponemataceae bacterium]|nr:MAG: YitT family protein [Treponemataceae bacterium]